MIDRLRSVQQSGKSVGIMESSGGLGFAVSDPATFSSFVAGGDLFVDRFNGGSGRSGCGELWYVSGRID